MRGFTLVELLITIVIVAIMLALAVPSYSNITTVKRMSSELNALVVDIQYARSEALRQGAQVEICASSDGKTCSNATAWQTGWIVYCVGTGCAASTVLKVKQAFNGPETFNANNNISALVFGPTGYPYPGLNSTGVTFTMHDATNSQSLTRCVFMSMVGQLSAMSYTPGKCT